MPSAADPTGGTEYDEVTQDKKRRRTHRACDMCRLRRVKCEGGEMAYRACANCIKGQHDCTYTQSSTKSTDPDRVYIRKLESRLERMEQLMEKFAPNNDLKSELWDHADSASSSTSGSTTGRVLVEKPTRVFTPRIPVDADDVDSSDDEFAARETLEGLFRTGITLDPGRNHFFGKSSGLMLLQKAMDMRTGYSERSTREASLASSQFDWGKDPWMETFSERPKFVFPPTDLMPSLIHLYFSGYNAYVPLLHRPTFEKAVTSQSHLRDDGFASTLLLVCAIGARISDDPRVRVEGYDSYHSAGWKWFHQAHSAFKMVNYTPPRLYDLQSACLISQFLHGSSSPYASWPVIGVGLRLVQSLGAHRRKFYDTAPRVEAELLKRAFWVLVNQDRGVSSAFGRPCGIQDEDFDVELPLECDDEYWETPDPAQAFKQPPGKPSRVAFFNCTIRLSQIQAFAMRTVYPISKPKTSLGHAPGPEWNEKTVAEIDSALNSFIDSLPDHLRWNPQQEDMLTLSQSAYLYAQYYSLQITVHRQFISTPRKYVRSSFPSLAICTNAARSALHVLDVQYRRVQETREAGEFHEILAPVQVVFHASMVLLLNIWERKRSGAPSDYTKDLSDVYKAMDMLKASERRTYAAGKLWECLNQLASFGDLPLPSSGLHDPATRTTTARRNDDSPAPTTSATSTTVSLELNIAEHAFISDLEDPLFGPSMGMQPILPLHGSELGRLPVYTRGDTQVRVASSVLPHQPTSQVSPPPTAPSSYLASTSFPNRTATAFSAVAEGVYAYQPAQTSGYLHGLPAPGSATATAADAVLDGHAVNSIIERDVLEMWSSAPSGFEWEDWGNYLTNLGSFHDTHGP